MRFISTVLILLLPLIVKAQAYVPILSDSTTWYLTSQFFGFNTDTYWAADDTLIQGKDYKVLDGFHFNKNVFVREDTVSKQFFYRQIINFRANQDVLIYDFNMNVGDSMILYNPNVGGFSDSAGMFTLDSIALVNTLEGQRKKYFWRGPKDLSGNTMRAEWIEGIGSTYAVNSGGAAGDLSDHGEMACVFKNNKHVYQSDLSTQFGNCYIYTVGMGEYAKETNILYPNPCRTEVNIKGIKTDLEFSIFDAAGSTKMKGRTVSGKIDLRTLENGLYLIKLGSGKSTWPIQKIMVLD